MKKLVFVFMVWLAIPVSFAFSSLALASAAQAVDNFNEAKRIINRNLELF
ncbi:MAG: hypothetical protein IPK04_15920 [Bdellovibrionales bacterium]|nr:hypothetical protein [Bdellovibrionales bacterium]